MGGAHASAARDQTLDVARGLAIAAIVVGHVLRGLVAAGMIPGSSAAYRETDRVLYLVHLAVFVVVSGLFVRQGVERRGVGRAGIARYLRGRVGLFLYLYLLWTLVQGGTMLAMSSVVNTPTSIAALLELWRPIGQLWFFPFLALVTTVTALATPWRSRPLRPACCLLIALVISMLSWGDLGVVVGPQGMSLLVLFVAGAVVSAAPVLDLLARVTPVSVVVTLVVAMAAFVALLWTPAVPPTSGGAGSPLSARLLGLVAACVGVVAVVMASRACVMAARWIVAAPVALAFAFLGRRSLEVFVAHILAASGTRVLLVHIGVQSVPVQIGAGVVGGVALPLALWWVSERLGVRFLFAAPRVLTGGVVRTAGASGRGSRRARRARHGVTDGLLTIHRDNP